MTGKNIVLLSDGTGNSAASLSKTNVWRLYRALDLAQSPEHGTPRQVAIYRDGVGTSSFRPLALLGGIFGVGLSRNVIDLYKYLCGAYQPGDRIYAFGFSRGAFTIRIVVALVLAQGLVPAGTAEELDRYAPDAYRAYRRRFKLPIFGRKSAYADDPSGHADETVGLVDLLRNVRDAVIGGWRRLTGTPGYDPKLNRHVDEIAFLGVWDTVAAYGLPLDELTRGIDQWVWPLSMPNYELSPKVACARHALALDEERDSFAPLLWDETKEPPDGCAPDRLQQVWFAGVHSNVGGGYPDDTLSYVPLAWMIEEARARGLRFNPPDRCEAYPPPNPLGRLYDSRAGVGAYYRYQPRRLGALLLKPKRDTLILRDPQRRGRGFLRTALVHDSVFERIGGSAAHYAPTSLTSDVTVVGTIGSPPPRPVPDIAPSDSPVWTKLRNDIWRRRIAYFSTVFLSAALVAFPFVQAEFPPTLCEGPQCIVAPIFGLVGGFLPGFLSFWLDAFARAPGTFLVLALGIAGVMSWSGILQQRIRDDARALWNRPVPETALPGGELRIARLRSSSAYQSGFQFFKWGLAPFVFGISVLLLVVGVVILAPFLIHTRTRIALAERSGAICELPLADRAGTPADVGRFSTGALCWSTGKDLVEGHRYRLVITPAEAWADDTIAASPLGYEAGRRPIWKRAGFLLRRSISARWFQPVLRIDRPGRAPHLTPLEFSRTSAGADGSAGYTAEYMAEFRADATGAAGLFVNDVVSNGLRLTSSFYANNRGTAAIRIDEIEPVR